MRAERLAAIHHVQVAIPAGGEDAARRFYGEVLGLREIEKPENLRARGGVWFETGSMQLHLGVDPEFTPATKAHVAFDVDDLATVRERCEAAGRPVREDEPLPGYDRIYVDDPFGNRMEILQPVVSPEGLTAYLLNGPDLSELDLCRDRSLMRDVDLS